MSNFTERYYAAMESARNTASEEYFKARPQLDPTVEQRFLFNAGFERAYKPLYEALSQIQWMKDCGIDEPDPSNPGMYRNCTEQERDGMYSIATKAIGASADAISRERGQPERAEMTAIHHQPPRAAEPVLTEYKCYYNVEMAAGEDGCIHCGAGKMWAIVYVEHGQKEKTEISKTFGDRELADDICDLMNMAYEAGLELTMNLSQRKRLAGYLIEHVCEIPDRSSPDDKPEMMLVTGAELENALLCSFERYDAEPQSDGSVVHGETETVTKK